MACVWRVFSSPLPQRLTMPNMVSKCQHSINCYRHALIDADFIQNLNRNQVRILRSNVMNNKVKIMSIFFIPIKLNGWIEHWAKWAVTFTNLIFSVCTNLNRYSLDPRGARMHRPWTMTLANNRTIQIVRHQLQPNHIASLEMAYELENRQNKIARNIRSIAQTTKN